MNQGGRTGYGLPPQSPGLSQQEESEPSPGITGREGNPTEMCPWPASGASW